MQVSALIKQMPHHYIILYQIENVLLFIVEKIGENTKQNSMKKMNVLQDVKMIIVMNMRIYVIKFVLMEQKLLILYVKKKKLD